MNIFSIDAKNILILRWFLIAVTWLAYVTAFPTLFASMGPAAFSLSGLPVLLTAWYNGIIGGVIGAAIVTLINAVLMYWMMGEGWSYIILNNTYGIILLLFGGIVVGRIQDLRGKLLTELKEKETSAAKYQSIVQSSSDGIILINEEGKVIEWNQGQVEITGIRSEEAINRYIWDLVYTIEPDTQKTPTSKIDYRDEVLNATKTGEGYWLEQLSEQEIEHTDGTRFFIQTRKYPIRTNRGFMIGFFSRDITERKKNEEILIRSEERYREMVSQSADGILIANEDLEIIEWSDSQTDIFGYTKEEMIGKPIWQFQYNLVPEENRPPGFLDHVKKRAQEVKQKGIQIFDDQPTDFEIQTKDGTRKTIQISSFPIHTSAGTLTGTIIRDISDQKEFERHLQHTATHDALTNLPNRTLLLDRLDHSIARAQRNNSRLGVLYIDLDNFKDINDTYGHSAGDFVLQEFTSRILDETRKSDTFARISGDEFVMLMESISDSKQAEVLGEKIIQLVNKPFDMNGSTFEVTLSIGVSIYPDDGGTSLRLIQQADAAMYEAKKAGKNNMQISSDR